MTDLALEKFLKTFDVPAHRKDNFNLNNLQWLDKNLKIKNSDNKNFDLVSEEIYDRLKNKKYSK